MTPEAIQQFQQYVQTIRADAVLFAPEIVLTVGALAILLLDLLIPVRRSRDLAWAAVATVAAAAWLVWSGTAGPERSIFSGMLAVDGFSAFFKLIFLTATAVVALMAYTSRALSSLRMGEFYCLLLCSLLGAFLMASAQDLLMVYIGVELLSVPSYVLTAYHRRDRHGSEASLKYVIYGGFSSGAMLYGISLLYGIAGSTDMARIGEALVGADHLLLGIASVLVFAGVAYKISAVPMHFWTPDVYQGAPTPVTAYLSVPSKAAGFALFLRILYSLNLGDAGVDWLWITAVVSAVTMTLGNLAALWQDDVKRMLGYSSIAHAGYLLMGVAAMESPGYSGMSAVLFYLALYLFMNLGAFAVVVLVQNRSGSSHMRAFRGAGYSLPAAGACMVVFLVSLIGIPPTAGFVGKWMLLAAVMQDPELLWLAVLAVLNTAVSAFYYLRIAKAMYMEDPADDAGALPAAEAAPVGFQMLSVALAAITLWLGLFWGGLSALATHLMPYVG